MPEAAVVRPPIAVLLSRFPLVTETFILREVIEMERQGQPVRLVPLMRESPAVIHREAVPWTRSALFTPFLSSAILAANARALRRAPTLYLRILAEIVRGSLGSLNLLLRALALFPKSVYLAERLQREGVGHVHAHFATHPALAAYVVWRLTGIPYSVSAHAHDIFVRRALLRQKLGGAALVRTISRFNRDLLASLYPELAGRLEVIHAGVDPRAYEGAGPPPADSPRLLCVAALKPYKGLPVLVEACRILRNRGQAFRCDIVGEGPGRRSLEATVLRARLQDHVRFRGPQPQDEIGRLLSEANVFVLPSVVAGDGQMEGIPVALMEAMAAGRPVVASRLSGIPELVEDGCNGVLVPPGDAEALADAIAGVLADPSRARAIGERARETIRRDFRIDRVVRTLLDHIATPADGPWTERLAAVRWPDGGHGPVGLRRVHDGRDSTVALLIVPNGSAPGEVAFKVHKAFAGQSAPPADRARRELEVLRRLHGAFAGESGMGVPRPLLVADDAVIMEACAGIPLDGMAREVRWRDARASRTTLGPSVNRAGAWLRVFQRATTRAQPAADRLDRLLTAARADLRACPDAGVRAAVKELERRIDDVAREARPALGPVVGRHGDFRPGNVLVDEDRVRVIDFEGFGEGLPAEDVADFLLQLELLHGWPGLARAAACLRAAFLEGYGRDRLDPRLYRLCRLASAIRELRRSAERDHGWPSRWHRRALRRLLRAS